MLIRCGVWERGVKSEVNSGVRLREFNSEGNMFGSKSPANSLYFKIDAHTAHHCLMRMVKYSKYFLE